MAIKSIDLPEEFTSAMNQPAAVIKIYTPDCKDCAEVKPKYKEFAQDKKYRHITFYQANYQQLGQICNQHNVVYTPAFLFCKHGVVKHNVVTSKRSEIRQGLDML